MEKSFSSFNSSFPFFGTSQENFNLKLQPVGNLKERLLVQELAISEKKIMGENLPQIKKKLGGKWRHCFQFIVEISMRYVLYIVASPSLLEADATSCVKPSHVATLPDKKAAFFTFCEVGGG